MIPAVQHLKAAYEKIPLYKSWLINANTFYELTENNDRTGLIVIHGHKLTDICYVPFDNNSDNYFFFTQMYFIYIFIYLCILFSFKLAFLSGSYENNTGHF